MAKWVTNDQFPHPHLTPYTLTPPTYLGPHKVTDTQFTTLVLYIILFSLSQTQSFPQVPTYLPTLIVFDLQNNQSQTHTSFYFHTIIVITKFVFSNG